MSDIIPEILPQPQQDIIVLAPADQARFVEMLLNPPPLAPAMERALEANALLFKRAS